MNDTYFVSDLHGKLDRYSKLFRQIEEYPPDLVLMGGDLLPSGTVLHRKYDEKHSDFIGEYLIPELTRLKEKLEKDYPLILVILGNDDPRSEEQKLIDAESLGLFKYIHNRKVYFRDFKFYGYANIPPSPFLLKDWEKFDVSHYVDVGSISPQQGYRSVKVDPEEIDYYTIEKDLDRLVAGDDLYNAVFLFHSPPYRTSLDRAELDGRSIDHAPVDVHVGSIAIRRLIENRQPYLALHGHIHESARLTGSWRDKIGKTPIISAAHDGSELALIRFPLEQPELTERMLL